MIKVTVFLQFSETPKNNEFSGGKKGGKVGNVGTNPARKI
jgi:hypothetical protein